MDEKNMQLCINMMLSKALYCPQSCGIPFCGDRTMVEILYLNSVTYIVTNNTIVPKIPTESPNNTSEKAELFQTLNPKKGQAL